jgi:hypothetical protein
MFYQHYFNHRQFFSHHHIVEMRLFLFQDVANMHFRSSVTTIGLSRGMPSTVLISSSQRRAVQYTGIIGLGRDVLMGWRYMGWRYLSIILLQ